MQNLEVKTERKSYTETSPTVGGRQVTVNAERQKGGKTCQFWKISQSGPGPWGLGLETVERSAVQKQVESFQSGPFKVTV
jgi:hypothetical protein